MSHPDAPWKFETTRWSLVRAVGGSDPALAQWALSQLCKSYWYPIYAYIRRSGRCADDAEDLTQGFFAKLLERSMLGTANPDRGKLRNFLLGCVNHYLSDQRDRDLAQKRGAGCLVSFDGSRAEDRYGTEPSDDLSPDRLFQRRWAITILEEALERTREEFSNQGKAEIFEALRPFLGFGPEPKMGYDELSAKLAMPIGTLKSHTARLRQRWRDIIFEQVAMTLDDPSPEQIKAELAELLGCV